MLNVSQLTQFFREEKDIYVQNISDAQVSVAFEVATGHVESHLFANTRDPVCLTTYLPFNVIKNSMDFRKMLIRRPAALVLLTEEEYRAYYTKRAQSIGVFTKDEKGKKVPDADEAIRRAEDDRQGVLRRDTLPDATEPQPIRDIKSEAEHDDGDDFAPGQLAGKELVIEDLVNPRILNLCNQVNPGLTDQQKMPASAMLSELQKMTDGLKVADWEHVTHHGHYKSVKNFARKQLSTLASQA